MAKYEMYEENKSTDLNQEWNVLKENLPITLLTDEDNVGDDGGGETFNTNHSDNIITDRWVAPACQLEAKSSIHISMPQYYITWNLQGIISPILKMNHLRLKHVTAS